METSPYGSLFDSEKVRAVAPDFGFDSPHFVLSEDFNNDGARDIVVLASGNGLWYFQNQGFGKFDAGGEKINGINGLPKHAVAKDFDFDGDIDLLVAIPSEDELLLLKNQFKESGKTSVIFELIKINATSRNLDNPIYLASADFDGDYDLDFAVVCRARGEVLWYANDGMANFTFADVIAEDLDEPRCIEILNLTYTQSLKDRDFSCRDLAIGRKGGVSLYENSGNGLFRHYQDISINESSSQLIVNSVNALALDSTITQTLCSSPVLKCSLLFSQGCIRS